MKGCIGGRHCWIYVGMVSKPWTTFRYVQPRFAVFNSVLFADIHDATYYTSIDISGKHFYDWHDIRNNIINSHNWIARQEWLGSDLATQYHIQHQSS